MSKYRLRLYINTFLILTILAGFCFASISCSSRIDISNMRTSSVQVQSQTNMRNNTQSSDTKQVLSSNLEIRIAIAHFFIEYLEDLLGIDGIEGLIQEIELEAYLTSLTSVNNARITTQDYSIPNILQDSFTVQLHTTDLLTTLEALQIPYTKKSLGAGQKISLSISRDFIISFINTFPELRDIDLANIFLPDPKIISQNQFSEYIAWSFSEYQSKTKIAESLENSAIHFTMEKGTSIASKQLDTHWKKIANSADSNKSTIFSQERFFKFVPLLYEDYQELIFTY